MVWIRMLMVAIRRNRWIQDILKVEQIGLAQVDWIWVTEAGLCVKDDSKIIGLSC